MEWPFMNVTEAADALGIQPGAVRDAIARGRLTAIRKGGGQRAGFLLIERGEIEHYWQEHLGKRGVAHPSHPLYGKGRPRKKDKCRCIPRRRCQPKTGE